MTIVMGAYGGRSHTAQKLGLSETYSSFELSTDGMERISF